MSELIQQERTESPKELCLCFLSGLLFNLRDR